ncbi:hypothetical protein T265_16276, partial [Opisthorchis viverrini]
MGRCTDAASMNVLRKQHWAVSQILSGMTLNDAPS